MRFSLVAHFSPLLDPAMRWLASLGTAFERERAIRGYGHGVAQVVIGVLVLGDDAERRSVRRARYLPAHATVQGRSAAGGAQLTFDLGLPAYELYLASTPGELGTLMAQAVLAAGASVNAVSVPDFDTARFLGDLAAFCTDYAARGGGRGPLAAP